LNFSNLFAREDIVTQPLFYIFVAFSALLGFAFFRGKRVNDRMFRGAFQDLIDVFRPVDQTFTNIGGSIGYHAQLSARKADVVEKVEATITFLPRQALLWMPISPPHPQIRPPLYHPLSTPQTPGRRAPNRKGLCRFPGAENNQCRPPPAGAGPLGKQRFPPLLRQRNDPPAAPPVPQPPGDAGDDPPHRPCPGGKEVLCIHDPYPGAGGRPSIPGLSVAPLGSQNAGKITALSGARGAREFNSGSQRAGKDRVKTD